MIERIESTVEQDAHELGRVSDLLQATGARELFLQVAEIIPGTNVREYLGVNNSTSRKNYRLSVALNGPSQIRQVGRIVMEKGVERVQEESHVRLQISTFPLSTPPYVPSSLFYIDCEEVGVGVGAEGVALLWSEPITNHSNLAGVIKQGLERAGIHPPADKAEEFNALFER